jgi:hypothetical protein
MWNAPKLQQRLSDKTFANTKLCFLKTNLTYVALNEGFKDMTLKKQAEKIYFTGPVFGPRSTLPYYLSSTR